MSFARRTPVHGGKERWRHFSFKDDIRLLSYCLVFLGAGLGGISRHGVNRACAAWCGTEFPYGTLTINVLGGFLMGCLAGWLAFKTGAEGSQNLRLFLATGVLGGFTTFSAFSLDAVLLWERGAIGAMLAYIAASVLLSIGAVVGGLLLVRG